jgi:hypothetical protein
LSNQDCISIILASFTGSPSAIVTYRLYSSIDLLLHSTFTRRRWFWNGRGAAAVLEWKRRGAAVVLECKRSGGRRFWNGRERRRAVSGSILITNLPLTYEATPHKLEY